MLPQLVAERSEERGHRRKAIRLAARYLFSDRREAEGTVVNVAEGRVGITGPDTGRYGDHVIAYVDKLGRVEGNIDRHFRGGFELRLTGSKATLQRFEWRVRKLNSIGIDALERRRHVRVGAADLASTIVVGEGRDYEVVNLSLSGADVRMFPRPAVGEILSVGEMACRVVRHTQSGVAVAFLGLSGEETIAGLFARLFTFGEAYRA